MGDSAGRARGFGARGRGFTTGAAGLGDNGGNGNGGNGNGGNGNGGNGGNGSGDGGAIRGRGGYHQMRAGPIRTLPPNIHATAGEGGIVIRVQSNYFKVITPKVVVHQYHVTFEPEIEATKVRRGMIYDQRGVFDGPYLFDGGSNVKALTRLPNETTQIAAIRKTDNAQITITFKYTGEVGWGHPEMVRLYNTQVRRNLFNLNYVLIGRYMFDPKVRHKLPDHNLEIWQGVITAVNDHDGGLLMVCDTIHKFVRSDTVLDVLKAVYKRDPKTFKENAQKEITDCIVMSSYNNKTYKIDDIDFNKSPQSTFERKSGPISFVQYYTEQYKMTITDMRQPLLICLPSERQKRAGVTEPILLVPELCIMTGLTESLRNNNDLKRKSMELTRMDPSRRVQNLHGFMANMQGNPTCKSEMDQWGIQFEPNVVELAARILPAEKILMRNDTDGFPYNQESGDFGKEMRSKQMRVPLEIPTWGIICTSRDSQTAEEFASTLNRVAGPLGIRLSRPNIVPINSDRLGDFVDTCKRVPEHVKIIVIIVPNNNKDRYDTIKKIFCCERPIASQVVVFRTLSKKQMLMSVCTKVAIQMACKLGAEPWALSIPPKNLMVIGYDTYHDSLQKNKSVGGFVCSLNPSLTRWYSRVSYHGSREEMSSNFSSNFQQGLKRYHELNNRLPERIIVYRDGVADNQIQHVFEIELAQIKNALKTIAGDEALKLAFVIVTKRVNARFFAKQGRDLRNPIPGTIVDTVVTRKERYDFYLVSQSVRQGTVSPTMYNIIEDETGWKPTHHQQLAYKLTHLYFNWQGTISVPAPCQYAHKLAFLTGTSLHREPNVKLADTLFYL